MVVCVCREGGAGACDVGIGRCLTEAVSAVWLVFFTVEKGREIYMILVSAITAKMILDIDIGRSFYINVINKTTTLYF